MMRFLRRASWTAVLLAGIAAGGAACDDDDGGGDATSTPSVVAQASAGPTQPVATAAPRPTIDVEHTPGPAATLQLSAEPAELVCDGDRASMVTALVLDRDGQPVDDGTRVNFSVQVSGTADPINAETEGGVATTSVVALGEGIGVVVNVTSGDAAMALRIDCL